MITAIQVAQRRHAGRLASYGGPAIASVPDSLDIGRVTADRACGGDASRHPERMMLAVRRSSMLLPPARLAALDDER